MVLTKSLQNGEIPPPFISLFQTIERVNKDITRNAYRLSWTLFGVLVVVINIE